PLPSFPTRRSSDLGPGGAAVRGHVGRLLRVASDPARVLVNETDPLNEVIGSEILLLPGEATVRGLGDVDRAPSIALDGCEPCAARRPRHLPKPLARTRAYEARLPGLPAV